MKKFLFCALALGVLISCGQSNKQKQAASEETISTEDNVPQLVDEHTAKNSLDYFGVYEGLTPCADCEGILVRVTIRKDETFALHTAYIKNGKELSPEDFTGNYEWNKAGNTITLKSTQNFPKQIFVAEGRIFLLDQEGKKIETPNAEYYILPQIEVFN